MLDILVLVVAGVVIGVAMGLLPGVHPNMVVLLIPFLISTGIAPLPLLAMIVAVGVTNAIVDFIPTILLGAPDGNELSTLPGHRMLLAGEGYNAVKLSVVGALGAIILVSMLFPVLVFAIPALYEFISPVIPLLLLLVLSMIILSEKGSNKYVSVVVMVLAGSIGLLSASLGINSNLVLFPIFTGFFGISVLLIQLRAKPKLPRQQAKGLEMSRKTLNKSVILGTIGGIASGFLPGIGSSEIGAVVSVDKNEKSFLITMGAISSANILLSILSLWLIGNARSGLAVVISNVMELSFMHILFIVLAALACAGIASIITLAVAKKFLGIMHRVDYSAISITVILFLASCVLFFTGLPGMVLLITSAALGIFVNTAGLRRGILMSVLIIPTLLFYAGF